MCHADLGGAEVGQADVADKSKAQRLAVQI
jgi:hypothetical protein